MADVETRGAWAAISEAMRDVRAAEDDLRAEQDEAWRRYLERVDAILAFDLQMEDEPDDDHDASHLLASVRTQVGELRLRSHLAALEGEELVGRVRAALRRMTC